MTFYTTTGPLLSHFLDATKLTLTNLEIVILIYIFSLKILHRRKHILNVYLWAAVAYYRSYKGPSGLYLKNTNVCVLLTGVAFEEHESNCLQMQIKCI